MIIHLCRTYFPLAAASPWWYTDTQAVGGTTMGSEHIQQVINCTLQRFYLHSISSSHCPAKPLTQPSHSFTVLFSSLCLLCPETLLFCVRLHVATILNASLKLIFLQWSNFFTSVLAIKSQGILPRTLPFSLRLSSCLSLCRNLIVPNCCKKGINPVL